MKYLVKIDCNYISHPPQGMVEVTWPVYSIRKELTEKQIMVLLQTGTWGELMYNSRAVSVNLSLSLYDDKIDWPKVVYAVTAEIADRQQGE